MIFSFLMCSIASCFTALAFGFSDSSCELSYFSVPPHFISEKALLMDNWHGNRAWRNQNKVVLYNLVGLKWNMYVVC